MAENIQDMPPKGGYSKINFARVPAKKLFTGIQVIVGVLACHYAAVYTRMNITKPMLRRNEIEMRSATIALYPFMRAERDRRELLQMSKNRDAEAELMKDVEGWEVGRWEGQPIFKTVAENDWVEPIFEEHYAHSHPSDLMHHWLMFHRR